MVCDVALSVDDVDVVVCFKLASALEIPAIKDDVSIDIAGDEWDDFDVVGVGNIDVLDRYMLAFEDDMRELGRLITVFRGGPMLVVELRAGAV